MKRRPVLRFPDRQYECESISISATRLELEAGLQDVEVTDFGVFAESENGFRFMPHLQVHAISAYKPRPRGRPKAPPKHESLIETFEYRQVAGPRHRPEKKSKGIVGGPPTAPLNR